ncbi:nose resistant to fluoxetine protein 6-like [Littorina saxatilis]
MIVEQVIKGQMQIKGINISKVFCRHHESSGPSPAASGMIAFLALWALLLISATFMDCWCGRSTAVNPRQQQTQEQTQRSQQPASTSKARAQPAKRQNNFNASASLSDGVDADEIETDIDSDVVTISSTQPLTSRSVTRLPLGRRSRQIRGILRGKLERSLLRSAEDAEKRQLSNLSKLAKCFSLKANLEKLLDTSTSSTELGCLHGIRVVSLAWVVLVNTVMYQVLFSRNAFRLFKDWQHNNFRYALIGNGHLSLDSLFALSGLLVGYAYSMKLDRRRGRLNWMMFVFRRYWRTVPTMLIVGVVYVALFPYLTQGPLAPDRAPDEEACLKWGWMHVLLLQNFSPSTSTCMSWTWFLAVDFQLFLLTPVLLWVLYRRPYVTYASVFVVVLLSCIVSGVLTRTYDLPVAQFIPPDLNNLTNKFNPDDFASLYFYKPWAHAGAFYPPLLVGYLLYQSSRRASFRTRTVVAGWGLAVIASLVVLFGVRKELVAGRTFSSETLAFYNAVHRSVWGLCISWTVLACSTGYGGPVNSLLSWSGWKPLSRLVFAAYLIHPVVAQAFNACLEQLLYMSSAVAVYQYLGVLVCSLLLSALITVTFEMPLTALPVWVSSCCSYAARN